MACIGKGFLLHLSNCVEYAEIRIRKLSSDEISIDRCEFKSWPFEFALFYPFQIIVVFNTNRLAWPPSSRQKIWQGSENLKGKKRKDGNAEGKGRMKKCKKATTMKLQVHPSLVVFFLGHYSNIDTLPDSPIKRLICYSSLYLSRVAFLSNFHFILSSMNLYYIQIAK